MYDDVNATGLIHDENKNTLEKIELVLPSIKRFFSSTQFKYLLHQWGNLLSDEILTAMVNHALENQYQEHTQILSDFCFKYARDVQPGVPYLIALLRDQESLLSVCSLNPDVSARLSEKSLANRYKDFTGYGILEFAIRELCEQNDEVALNEGLAYIDNLIKRGATPNQLTLRLITGDYQKQIFLAIWNKLNTDKKLDPLFSDHFTNFLCESSQDIRDNIKVINHFLNQEAVEKKTLHSFFMKLFSTHDISLYEDFFKKWLPQYQPRLLLNTALVAAIDANEPDVLHLLLEMGAELNQHWNDKKNSIIYRCKKKPECLLKIASWVEKNPAKFFYCPPEDLEEFLFLMIKKDKGPGIRAFIDVGIEWKTPEYTETTRWSTSCDGGGEDNYFEVFGGYNTSSLLFACLWRKDLETFKKLVACRYPINNSMPYLLRMEADVVHGERFCKKELKSYIEALDKPAIETVSDKRCSLFGRKNELPVTTDVSPTVQSKQL